MPRSLEYAGSKTTTEYQGLWVRRVTASGHNSREGSIGAAMFIIIILSNQTVITTTNSYYCQPAEGHSFPCHGSE